MLYFNLDYRTYGIPTIRTDIAPPRLRRISDRNNYGDESNAFGLLCPSIFTQNMVYERDIFKSRPKEEVTYKARKKHIYRYSGQPNLAKHSNPNIVGRDRCLEDIGLIAWLYTKIQWHIVKLEAT